jgi:Domain of unknown function (DUF4157)/Lysine-specific metallo-endopeptidase
MGAERVHAIPAVGAVGSLAMARVSVWSRPAVSRPPVFLQRKLRIGAVDDPLEREADARADAVMRGAGGRVSVAGAQVGVQRQCAGCSGGHKCSQCAEEEDTNLARKERAGVSSLDGAAAPAAVHDVLRSPGQGLGADARQFFEARFGRSFGDVRVHHDSRAAASAAQVNALAYTVGNHIVFGAGQYRPSDEEGRRLIAHELTHTVQQSRAGLSVQRFVACTPGGVCPPREQGEEVHSRTDPMIVEFIETPEVGYLVGGFGVAQSAVKASAKSLPNWKAMVAELSAPGSEWSMEGLTDCEGDEKQNEQLRQDRKHALQAALPPAAAAHIEISLVLGNVLDRCITENANAEQRRWNRAVLVTKELSTVDFEPEEVEGKRPVPGPVDQPTEGCLDEQKKAVAQAQPIGLDMVRKALVLLDDTSSEAGVKALLRKYFNDDSARAFKEVRASLLKIRKGLESSLKLKCERKSSPTYEKDCPEYTDRYVGAYAMKGDDAPIHICEKTFGLMDLGLAAVIVHETAHISDNDDDHEYCQGGCSAKLTPDEAFDNADSYARFVEEAYTAF